MGFHVFFETLGANNTDTDIFAPWKSKTTVFTCFYDVFLLLVANIRVLTVFCGQHLAKHWYLRSFQHAACCTKGTKTQSSQLFSATESPSPKKSLCLVQILAFKSHLGCSSSTAICQQWELQNIMQSQHISQEQVPWYIPCRSHSSAMCKLWSGKHHSTASTKKENMSAGSLCSSASAVRDAEGVRTRGSLHPSRKRANNSPQPNVCLPEKAQCFLHCKS